MRDPIDRQAAIDTLHMDLDIIPFVKAREYVGEAIKTVYNRLKELPSVQPEKEIPKRVLWSGWKGTRYTRYNCPNCTRPVRNDDVYCHRCGQKLMFPKISFTPYVSGDKQELIVRWDDEE